MAVAAVAPLGTGPRQCGGGPGGDGGADRGGASCCCGCGGSWAGAAMGGAAGVAIAAADGWALGLGGVLGGGRAGGAPGASAAAALGGGGGGAHCWMGRPAGGGGGAPVPATITGAPLSCGGCFGVSDGTASAGAGPAELSVGAGLMDGPSHAARGRRTCSTQSAPRGSDIAPGAAFGSGAAAGSEGGPPGTVTWINSQGSTSSALASSACAQRAASGSCKRDRPEAKDR